VAGRPAVPFTAPPRRLAGPCVRHPRRVAADPWRTRRIGARTWS